MTLPGTENFVKEFGDPVVIDDMSLIVREDERISITGPNGTGKSTLINLIARRFGPTSGDVRFKGELTVGLEPYQVAQRGVLKSFQTASIFPDLTVGENAEVAALAVECGVFGFKFLRHRDSLTDAHGIARDMLGSVGLLDHAGTIITDLPYGDKRRLETGIALANEPDPFPVDEPATGTSPEEMKSTVDLIEQIERDYGLTFVFVEHNMEIVFNVSDHIVVPNRNGITAEGTLDEIQGNGAVQEAYLRGVEL